MEELDVMPESFLETILIFLLPSSKQESAIAYQVRHEANSHTLS